jgi:hypothetical protein
VIQAIPVPAPSDVETHTFRWALGQDLNKTRCAFPSTPFRFPNDTLHPDPEWSTLHGGKYSHFCELYKCEILRHNIVGCCINTR